MAVILHAGRLGVGALQAVAKVGQRRAQIVGNVVTGLAQAVHQHLDAIEHAVDRGRQPLQFATLAGHRNAVAQMACHDRMAGVGNRIDTLGEAAA